MSDKSAEDSSDEMIHSFAVEMSERELCSIGKIVALWGSLEHEIFCQTLERLNPTSASELPKGMNNLQFSQVLELWKTHVADTATGKRKEVLQQQHKAIRHYSDFRNAIVHGMWDWSTAAPEKLTVSRIRNKEIRYTHFTAADLASLAQELGVINFKLRYPRGIEDYAETMINQGSGMSRLAFCLMTNNPLTEDLLPSFPHQIPEGSSG